MTGKSNVSIELIRENEDGSADCIVEMTQEEMEAFARIGIVAALEKAADVHASDISLERVDEKGKQRHEWVVCPTCEALARTVMLDQTYHDLHREWVGLTDEEIADIVVEMNGNEPTAPFWRDLARTIEATLKEKNTWVTND